MTKGKNLVHTILINIFSAMREDYESELIRESLIKARRSRLVKEHEAYLKTIYPTPEYQDCPGFCTFRSPLACKGCNLIEKKYG